MKEIHFRGICKDSKRWAYGYYVHFEDFSQGINYHGICSGYYNTHFEVIPETVGQYVGFDKNGKGIFEGDIVRLQNLKLLYEVYWDKKEARYKARNGGYVSPLCNAYNVFVEEVVGNVFDNTELLEE